MRKLVLIAAMSLLATQACAGKSRSLSLAAAEPTQTIVEQPNQQPTTQRADAPTATTKPSAATSTTTALAEPAKTQSTHRHETTSSRHRRPSLEARVIRELHRNGIYW